MRQRTRVALAPVIAKKILERAAAGEKAVVVMARGGKPAEVYGLDEYLQFRESTQRYQTRTHSVSSSLVPDPLGAVDGTVRHAIERELM